ncbi:MAG TPA: nuclear transport factor 2 family protein [Solirubrobacteraceae bacterium]
MSNTEANKQIVRGAYEGMAAGDAKAFLGVLDPAIEIHEPPFLPYGGTHRGVDGVIGFFQAAAAVVAPGKLAVEDLVADGDTVVATLTIGLRNGADAQVAEIWTLRDGKAVDVRVFWFDPEVAAA